ncbi:hypothetical protein Q4550_24360, partial [Anaerobacillus sp. 1_MG-2023]|nr:hypothetical protein [Anaerobacillus sp. 1_MG-2023]
RTPTLIEFNDDYKVNGTVVEEALGGSTGIKAIDEYAIATYLNGNDKVESENYVSYELGYRFEGDNTSLDLSAFHT